MKFVLKMCVRSSLDLADAIGSTHLLPPLFRHPSCKLNKEKDRSLMKWLVENDIPTVEDFVTTLGITTEPRSIEVQERSLSEERK